MTVIACSTLTFANCNNCTDVDPGTAKAECNSCSPGYALKDDNTTCTSMFYLLTIIFFIYSFLPDAGNKVVPKNSETVPMEAMSIPRAFLHLSLMIIDVYIR